MIRRLIILLLIVGCDNSTTPTPTHGCLDSQACNYDSSATIDNNSCIYNIDCEGVCGGELIEDCEGTCGGNFIVDNCGVCDTDTTNDCVQGCDEIWGSGLVLDECGTCGGDGILILGECYSINNTTQLTFSGYEQDMIITLPESIFSLINLQSLHISSTDIASIPESIGNLTNLTSLNISQNTQLTSLPESIFNMTSLEMLSITNTQLTSISDNIDNLINLTFLNLYANQLTSLPESICNIYSNLTSFGIGSNSLCGDIPACITDNPPEWLANQINEQNCP